MQADVIASAWLFGLARGMHPQTGFTATPFCRISPPPPLCHLHETDSRRTRKVHPSTD